MAVASFLPRRARTTYPRRLSSATASARCACALVDDGGLIPRSDTASAMRPCGASFAPTHEITTPLPSAAAPATTSPGLNSMDIGHSLSRSLDRSIQGAWAPRTGLSSPHAGNLGHHALHFSDGSVARVARLHDDGP